MIKIILMILSVLVILYGCNNNDQTVSIIGAIIFIIALLIDLYKIYISAKLHRDNKDYQKVLNVDIPIIQKADKFIEGSITIAGLIFSIIFRDKETIYFYPALMIWVGAILSLFMGGVIISHITNIPLRFGYGGWEIKKME